jgi:hypothetical protein
MPLILGTNSIKDTGYNVANSLRFDDGSSDYLTKADANPVSNNKTATYSFWCKRAALGSHQVVFAHQLDGTHESQMKFRDSDVFEWHGYDGDTASPHWVALYRTTQVFRDTSAWLHFVVALDSTSGTAGNRVKMYVNGTQITDFIGGSENIVPSQNANLMIDGGNSYNNRVGALAYNGNDPFDGYLAEFVFIDGQQLDPTSFGEFDSDSSPTIWKPKDVSGLTFGTKGFYLEFKQSGTSQNSSGLGADTSGNDRHFSVNNLTAVDQSIDTCTNNFATLNPLATGSLITLSEGNLKALGNNGSESSTSTATIGVTGGKFYWEAKIINTVSGYPYFGIYKDFDSLVQGNLQGQATGDRIMIVQANASTTVVIPGTDLSITAPANNDIIMFAVDRDNNKFYLGVNGTFLNSGDPTSGATGTGSLADLDANGVVMFGTHHYNASAIELNFGSPPYANSSGNTDGNGYGNFEYAPPSGYLALCTKNLGSDGG